MKNNTNKQTPAEMIQEFHTTFKVDKLGNPRAITAMEVASYLEGASKQLQEEMHELITGLNKLVSIRRIEDIELLKSAIDYMNAEDNPALAWEVNDIPVKKAKIESLDALADIVYVAFNIADKLDLDLETALERVHTSNMTKLDDNGEPLYWGPEAVQYGKIPGKIKKSENYEPPVLDDLVNMDDVEIPAPQDVADPTQEPKLEVVK